MMKQRPRKDAFLPHNLFSSKPETMRLHVEYVPLHEGYGLIARNGHLVATMAQHGKNKRAAQIAAKLALAWNLEAARDDV